MKTNQLELILLLLFAMGTIGAYAQDLEKTRSYYCQQTAGPDTRYGPNVQVPLRDATYVEWYSNNTIKMMDGTIWQYQGCYNGVHKYNFVRIAQGGLAAALPGRRFVEAFFSADFSRMQVNFYFSLGMMATPMTSTYVYIGDGTRPAFDWMSGKYLNE